MERITVILSGDPGRKRLCERVTDWYRKISIVKEAFFLYERNPAIAFNKGAKMDTFISHKLILFSQYV